MKCYMLFAEPVPDHGRMVIYKAMCDCCGRCGLSSLQRIADDFRLCDTALQVQALMASSDFAAVSDVAG